MPTIIRGIKNIFRNKIRNILIILVLCLASSLALMMINIYFSSNQKIKSINEIFGNSFGVGLSNEYREELYKKGVSKIEDNPELLLIDEKLADEISKIPSVIEIEKDIFGDFYSKKLTAPGITKFERSGEISQERSRYIPLSGIEDASSSRNLVKGNTFNRNDIEQNVALITEAFAENNKLDVGSSIIINGEKIKVIGIYKGECLGCVFPLENIQVPFKTAQRLLGCEGKVQFLFVTVDSIDNVQKTVNYINNKLSDGKIKAIQGMGEDDPSMLLLNNIKRISKVAMISSSIVAILIILSIMFINVRERAKEIGILKAIGASNFNISSQFLVESISLCIIALILSTAITLATSQPLADFISEREKTEIIEQRGGMPTDEELAEMSEDNKYLFGYTFLEELKSMNLNTIFSPQILIFAILLTFLLAVIGSLIPAYYISKLRPAEVLRFE